MVYVLVVVAFLLNGDPVPLIAITDEAGCGAYAATMLANDNAVKTGAEIQDLVLWDCKQVTSPGPQRHIPGKDEAATF